ncbi:hypothetical protein E1B28_008244 [Marasmius oreades]|uniref:Transmembrane protein n=1 Tax=Marasmius oreades TaxID=181124 RepID=A0A9P7RYL4_9AGAR|nr:uncharacterized protein E1B28_008244 [Marasmius oreades]KAG7091840.1 hypothetical protein E1B28_008244 [Marasmius oreades]
MSASETATTHVFSTVPIYQQVWFIVLISVTSVVLFFCLAVFVATRREKRDLESQLEKGLGEMTTSTSTSTLEDPTGLPTLPREKKGLLDGGL